MPELRIVPEDLAARVDARLLEASTQYIVSRGTGRREGPAPTGKALLSGGMLVCGSCGGNYELRKDVRRSKKTNEVVEVLRSYACSTRRRKPGKCTAGPIFIDVDRMNAAVLAAIEVEALGPQVVEQLMASAPRSTDEGRASIEAEVARVEAEVKAAVGKVLSGVLLDEEAKPYLDERRGKVARLKRDLASLPEAPADAGALRDALERRRADWKEALRGSVEVARLMVRRLVSPLTVTPGLVEAAPAWMLNYSGELKPALADGLMPVHNARLGAPASRRRRR